MNTMNTMILDSIIKSNYLFLGDIRNCGNIATYLKVTQKFPFNSCLGSRYKGIHAMTVVEMCGMWDAKWALNRLKNKGVKPTVEKIMNDYWKAHFYLSGQKKTLVQQELEKELKEVLGQPVVDQEMCVYEMQDDWFPERNTGWFLYSKSDINNEIKIDVPLLTSATTTKKEEDREHNNSV